LLHTKEIYSLHLTVPNPETISSAVEAWLLSRKGVNDKWMGWEEDEIVLLMSVIESVGHSIVSHFYNPHSTADY
jgi:hypothetical protein